MNYPKAEIVLFYLQILDGQLVYGNDTIHYPSSMGNNPTTGNPMFPQMVPKKEIFCEICGKKFKGTSGKSNLKKHLTIHAGLKPHSCSFCSKRFNQKIAKISHEMAIHGASNPNNN